MNLFENSLFNQHQTNSHIVQTNNFNNPASHLFDIKSAKLQYNKMSDVQKLGAHNLLANENPSKHFLDSSISNIGQPEIKDEITNFDENLNVSGQSNKSNSSASFTNHNQFTDKSTKCWDCNKQFASRQNFNAHYKSVHQKIKDFICDSCNYSTAHKSDLTRHKSSVHNIEKKSRYQ